jgi:hypothetical protein
MTVKTGKVPGKLPSVHSAIENAEAGSAFSMAELSCRTDARTQQAKLYIRLDKFDRKLVIPTCMALMSIRY